MPRDNCAVLWRGSILDDVHAAVNASPPQPTEEAIALVRRLLDFHDRTRRDGRISLHQRKTSSGRSVAGPQLVALILSCKSGGIAAPQFGQILRLVADDRAPALVNWMRTTLRREFLVLIPGLETHTANGTAFPEQAIGLLRALNYLAAISTRR